MSLSVSHRSRNIRPPTAAAQALQPARQKAVLALACCGEGDEDRDIIDVYEEVDKGIHI